MGQIDLTKVDHEGLYVPEEAPKPEAMRWIPISEKAPEDCTDVLLYMERDSWVYGTDQPVRKTEVNIGFYCDGSFYVVGCSNVKAIAWMPLPEAPGPCEYKDMVECGEERKL